MSQDRCPSCGNTVSLLDTGAMKIHFHNLTEIRPCKGSWKLVVDVITPHQSATDAELRERVIDRIRKLTALATNNSEAHEAASARKRANELRLQHGIPA